MSSCRETCWSEGLDGCKGEGEASGALVLFKSLFLLSLLSAKAVGNGGLAIDEYSGGVIPSNGP